MLFNYNSLSLLGVCTFLKQWLTRSWTLQIKLYLYSNKRKPLLTSDLFSSDFEKKNWPSKWWFYMCYKHCIIKDKNWILEKCILRHAHKGVNIYCIYIYIYIYIYIFKKMARTYCRGHIHTGLQGTYMFLGRGQEKHLVQWWRCTAFYCYTWMEREKDRRNLMSETQKENSYQSLKECSGYSNRIRVWYNVNMHYNGKLFSISASACCYSNFCIYLLFFLQN